MSSGHSNGCCVSLNFTPANSNKLTSCPTTSGTSKIDSTKGKTQKRTKAPKTKAPSGTNKNYPSATTASGLAALTHAAGFHSPETLSSNATLSALSMNGGVSATKEIEMSFVDYFDTSDDPAAAYFQWVWLSSQSVFQAGSVSNASTLYPCYPVAAELYALPKFDLDSSGSAVLCVITCPVENGASSLTAAGAVTSTLVLPTSVQKWVKVGGWRSSQLFDTSQYLPAIESDTGNQPIFSGVCLNPDTLAVAGSKLQMKLVLHLAQAVPPVVKMRYGVTNTANADCLNGPIGGISTTAKDCLVQVTGVSNTI